MKRHVSVLVTDLDNTLFDWVEIWHRSFSALLNELQRRSRVPMGELLDEIRTIHRRHGTSEYAFLAEELPCLHQLEPHDRAEAIAAANRARHHARNAATRLYPGVSQTLATFRRENVLVIGYTESTSFYTRRRVRTLGLDGLLDFLYSPPDHELPVVVSREDVRKHPPEHYEFVHTIHHHTPANELKPNPRLLADILNDVGASPEEAVYVGDSPMKDITMAQDAGVRDVLALYGKAQDRQAYELLRRVTHWTDADVARERQILERAEVSPTYVLERSFAEVLDLFSFSPFRSRRPAAAVA
jgi:FMN phosphatase YigB (HAD superfamily)